jgi:hypothetical protein
VQNSDFDKYSITAPQDSRLPGGGGFVINRPLRRGAREIRTDAELRDLRQRLRATRRGYWHGVDVSLNARLRKRPHRTRRDQHGPARHRHVRTCSWTNPSRRNCHVAEPFLTQLKGLATYTIPKIDLQLSGTAQSIPGSRARGQLRGVERRGAANARAARSPAARAYVTVNPAQPGSDVQRAHQPGDFRVAKLLRHGRTRTTIWSGNLFNAFNAATVLGVNQTYGSAWLTPTSVIQARFAKISAQIDFLKSS